MNSTLKCANSMRSHSATSQSIFRKGCSDSSLKPSRLTARFKPTKIKKAPRLVKHSQRPLLLANSNQKSKFLLKKEFETNLLEKPSFKFRLTQLSSINGSETGSNVPVQSAEENVAPPSISNQLSKGSSSSSRRKQYSPPPMTSSDASVLNESSSRSGSSSRSPSPIQKPSSSCRMAPLTSPCLQLSHPACDSNFCSSYDKELENILTQQQELCKLEEAKKNEVSRLNRQVEAVKQKELEIKRRELKLLKKRDKQRRREEIRQLECLKREETRKLEIEFLYRQNCLREEHEMTVELLRRKEAEINAYQTERYVSPSPEPCEIEKIDRTLESIEAIFAACNDQNQKVKSFCNTKDSHNKTLENLNNIRAEESDNYSFVKSGANDSHNMYRSNSIPSTSQYDYGSHRRWNSKNKDLSKASKSSYPKGKIIIKHESMYCNGGDCCAINGPTCTVIPTYGTQKQSHDMKELENCVKLCRFCKKDINRDTNSPCCLDERRRNKNNHCYSKYNKTPKDKKDRKKHFFWRDNKKTDNGKKRKHGNFNLNYKSENIKTFVYRAIEQLKGRQCKQLVNISFCQVNRIKILEEQ